MCDLNLTSILPQNATENDGAAHNEAMPASFFPAYELASELAGAAGPELALIGIGNLDSIVRGWTDIQSASWLKFLEWVEEQNLPPLPGDWRDVKPYAPFTGASAWQTRLAPMLRRRLGRNKPSTDQGGGVSIFEAVKNEVPLENYAVKFTDLEPAGPGKLRGRCPLHDERSPSFVVYLGTQSWHCFGACGIGGDIFTLVQRLRDGGRL